VVYFIIPCVGWLTFVFVIFDGFFFIRPFNTSNIFFFLIGLFSCKFLLLQLFDFVDYVVHF
jgi:hypothetical protein